MSFQDALRRNDFATAFRLVAKDHSLANAPDERGFPPLVLATYLNNLAFTNLLLDHGADPEAKDAKGNTALMGVCFKGYPKMAKLLLKRGADPNTQNPDGSTALHFTVLFDQPGCAEVLVAHGADVHLKDNRGISPLEAAEANGKADFVALLKK